MTPTKIVNSIKRNHLQILATARYIDALLRTQPEMVGFNEYEDLKAQGGLEAVAKYMADNPSPPEIAHTYDNQTAQQGIYTPGMNL